MPTFAKIPKYERAKRAVASGRFAVFATLLKAGPIFTKLQKLDRSNKRIPGHGYLTHEGKKYYYCLYGFINDESIYAQ